MDPNQMELTDEQIHEMQMQQQMQMQGMDPM